MVIQKFRSIFFMISIILTLQNISCDNSEKNTNEQEKQASYEQNLINTEDNNVKIYDENSFNYLKIGNIFYIYISANGHDTIDLDQKTGNYLNPVETLEGAYNLLKTIHDVIENTAEFSFHIVLKKNSAPILALKSGAEVIKWTISGSKDNPINIYSEDSMITITNVKDGSYLVHFDSTNYINITNVHFDKVTTGLQIDSCKYIKINYCKFSGSIIYGYGGGGTIWIGSNKQNPSEFNEIKHNYIENDNENAPYIARSLYHAIYISHYNNNNIFSYNTVIKPIGSGIKISNTNHNYNKISNNYIYKYNPDMWIEKPEDCFTKIETDEDGNELTLEEARNICNSINNQGNYEYNGKRYSSCNIDTLIAENRSCDPDPVNDRIINSGTCIYLGSKSNSSNNIIQNNRLYVNKIITSYGKNISLTKDGLFDPTNNNYDQTNIVYDNPITGIGTDLKQMPKDPYWEGYDSKQVTDRVVTGDFDNDGHINDIAAFYDYENGVTKIHLFKSNGTALAYSKPKTLNNYYVDKITGRIVVGDFDNDGFYDDIAAFYDYGNGETRIHMFLSNGSTFHYTGSQGYKKLIGYTASNFTGRVVSGDFDNDGHHDDIAVFYDYGSGQTRIHMFLSTGSTFHYTGSQGYKKLIGYTASNFNGRVVSGDFDNDGHHDDIAVFYAYGSDETRIHMFLSTGSDFRYTGSQGYRKLTGYSASNITGRVVSGDFDNDGHHDDIAVFYAYGSDETRIHMFLSNSSVFHYTGSQGYKKLIGYTASNITGRVVSGDFDNDAVSDIITFYDYGQHKTRTHYFKSNTSKFIYSGSMGIPWLF